MYIMPCFLTSSSDGSINLRVFFFLGLRIYEVHSSDRCTRRDLVRIAYQADRRRGHIITWSVKLSLNIVLLLLLLYSRCYQNNYFVNAPTLNVILCIKKKTKKLPRLPLHTPELIFSDKSLCVNNIIIIRFVRYN